MKQINLDTRVNLYTKTILSDYNVFLIHQLYMPIIGTDASALYITLANNVKMGKKNVYISDLTIFMDCSLNDFVSARKKLEAVGLISTYSTTNSEPKELSIVLYSPKSPKKFFENIVLKGLLTSKIGVEKSAELKDFLKIDKIDKNQLKEESASFIDVFSVNLDSDDFKYDPATNEILLDFKDKNSRLKFDFEYFLENLKLRIEVSDTSFSKEDRNTISSLANLYGYNEDFMIDVVENCFNIIEGTLDDKKLKKICFTSQVYENNVVKKVKNAAKLQQNNPNTAISLKIKYMEDLTPYKYLSLKQNNIKPVSSDMNVLSGLATRLGLTNGVINALVDYVLETNNNILSKNLIEKIGATLVREGIDNAFDAMNFLGALSNRSEKKVVAEQPKEKEQTQELDNSNDDVWSQLDEVI